MDGRFVAEIGQPGSGAGELCLSIDVAATAARVYVTDRTKQAVMVYGRDGKFITSWPGFNQPWGIAVGGNGDVYVADTAAGMVVVLNSDGNRIGTISGPGTRQDELTGPRGLDLGSDGLVYIADAGNQRVQIFTTGGRRIDTVTIQQINPALAAPVEDVSSDGAGNLYLLTRQFLLRLSRDASRRYQLQDTCVVNGGAGLDVDARVGVFVIRFTRTLLQAEVINFPYLGRCAEATRFGAFGGAVGLQNASRVSAGPSGSVALMSDAGVSLHDPNGRLRGVVPGPTPPTQGLQPNTNTRVQEVGFFADGSPVVANSLGAQRLSPSGRRLALARAPDADQPAPGRPTVADQLAYDSPGDRLYLLDIGHNLLAVRRADGSIVADQVYPVPNGFAAYRDLALTGEGYLAVVNQSTRQIEVRSNGWQLVGSISPTGIASRLATSGNHIFVLTRDGYVWRYRFTAGQPPELETGGTARRAGADSTWRRSATPSTSWTAPPIRCSFGRRILPAGPDPPPPPAGSPSRCNVDAVTLLDPDVVLVGEPFGVSIPVGGACPDSTPRTDIVLVIDRSGSMLSGGKMDAAKLAATSFITSVDYTQSQVAVVSVQLGGRPGPPVHDRSAGGGGGHREYAGRRRHRHRGRHPGRVARAGQPAPPSRRPGHHHPLDRRQLRRAQRADERPRGATGRPPPVRHRPGPGRERHPAHPPCLDPLRLLLRPRRRDLDRYLPGYRQTHPRRRALQAARSALSAAGRSALRGDGGRSGPSGDGSIAGNGTSAK